MLKCWSLLCKPGSKPKKLGNSYFYSREDLEDCLWKACKMQTREIVEENK